MRTHLAFLKRFKGALRLSLNATEDLLVNGARDPTERGPVKHLLSKVDKGSVDQALAREPLKSNLEQRVPFLAGIVRLNPEINTLLWYLETLSQVAERQQAAQALAITVDRMDFASVSASHLSRLVEVVMRTFEGHELVQAAFGLLASESFSSALERHEDRIGEDQATFLRPLSLAYRVVMNNEPLPDDEAKRELVSAGLATWLSAPDAVIRNYPDAVRFRLAEFGLQGIDGVKPEVSRSLLDSIPQKDEAYARLGMAWVERLLAEAQDEAALALLNQISQAQPKLHRVRQIVEALSWQKVGRLSLSEAGDGLQKGFWLEGAVFVWARVGDRERLLAEGELQSNLHLPGVLPALAFSASSKGAFVALPLVGRPLRAEMRWGKRDALATALEGLQILNALALAGVELPDAKPERFVTIKSRPAGLRLADLSGAVKCDPARASIAHGMMAHEWCRRLLAEREDLSVGLAQRMAKKAPLPVLAQVIALELARNDI